MDKNLINDYIKLERSKDSSQKAEIVRLDRKQNPTLCCLQETHFKVKDTNSVKV